MKLYPDIELSEFMDRKKQGTKDKRIKDRLESSINCFHEAFIGNSERWMKSGNWPEVLTLLKNLHRSVNAYYSRLFNQLNQQVEAHRSDKPVRSASDAIDYTTTERPLSSLTVPNQLSGAIFPMVKHS